MQNESIKVTQHGDVYVLTMNKGQNRFNPTFIKHINEALDFVEKTQGAAALVTVSSDEKFWSNGLDLEWMGANPTKIPSFVKEFQSMLARILTFPVPTIAALNGHAVAGGAMMAMAHDFRIMRADRGMFWLPEIEIAIPFTPGMNDILTCKLVNPILIRDAMIYGKKYMSKDCLENKIVDELSEIGKLLERATAVAQSVAARGADRKTMAGIKHEMFHKIADSLRAAELGKKNPMRSMAKL